MWGVPQPHRSPPAPEVLGCISPTALTPLPHSPGFPSDPAGVSVPQILLWPQGSLPHRYSPAPHAYPSVPQGSSGYLSSANTFVPPGTSRLSLPLLLPPSSGCLQDHEVPATCPMWSFHTSPQILLMCLCPIDLFMAQGPSAPSWPKGCSRLQP